jgi:two-component system LytT family response regulator
MNVKAVIIDDERASRLLLESKLSRLLPNIEIVGIADSADAGRALLLRESVDLVYLDISMPKETGFEFLEKIPNPSFEVIFVTGYNEYAIDAINLCAIGYVMKPISDEDILKATLNAFKRVEEKNQLLRNKQLLQNIALKNDSSKKIAVPFENEIIFLDLNNILYCKGKGGYTNIVCKDKNFMSSYSIGTFNSLLDKYDFFSTHKSYIVNLAYISSYKKEGIVVLSDEYEVPVSNRRKKDFLEALNHL